MAFPLILVYSRCANCETIPDFAVHCKYECSLIVVGLGWRYNLQILNGFADPKPIEIIAYEEDAVGFIFGFLDVSAATQRNKGRIIPYGLYVKTNKTAD